MSYLSLLFTPATQGMANASQNGRETEAEVRGVPEALEKAWTSMGGEANNYQLPSGIASLEHWLDLNA